MKHLLKCKKCNKEFINIDEAGEHSQETNHHEFQIKEIQTMELMIG